MRRRHDYWRPGPVFYWNLWKPWHYPSYVSYLACIVWNVHRLIGRNLPDQQWAYLVCMGWRGKKFFTLEETP